MTQYETKICLKKLGIKLDEGTIGSVVANEIFEELKNKKHFLPVKTLKDMTEKEKKSLEKLYDCKINPKNKKIKKRRKNHARIRPTPNHSKK